MTNSHLLRFFIHKNGDTIGRLADEIGMKRATLSAKINNHREFKQSEIAAIGKRYKMSREQCKKVFFAGWDE